MSTLNLNKGLGHSEETNWNILNEDVSLPCAVLYHSRIVNNLKWMQTFADLNHVKLAPHGKTTMTPDLFKLQLQSGAWGITLATAPQIFTAYQHGIKRLLLANQLVGKQNMQLMSHIANDSEVEFYCLVDSVANIEQLGHFFGEKKVPLRLLIEIGVPLGRCGCRDEETVYQLIETIEKFEYLQLSGIEFYEGVIHGEDEAKLISQFLHSTINLTQRLIAQKKFSEEQVILTGAGSAWYDLVAETFKTTALDNVTTIIRPGCYLIHDTGIYEQAQQAVLKRSLIASELTGTLQSSLEVWAYVQSLPEKGVAIIGLGKRDVAFDAGLPILQQHYRPDLSQKKLMLPVNPEWQLTNIMDQHAFMRIPEGADIQVGDMLAFSTSHPCLTFDKWRHVLMINDQYQVQKVMPTYF